MGNTATEITGEHASLTAPELLAVTAEGNAQGNSSLQQCSNIVLSPPEEEVDMLPVTVDGGVFKKVLLEGQGNPPPQFSRCLGALAFEVRS